MTLLSKAPWILALPLLGVGCGGGGSDPVGNNTLPAGFTTHSVTSYTATAVGTGDTAASQDLLTGGLGKTGIGAAAPPAPVDPLNPTALELRRNALHSNYRGLVDPTDGGGYGRIYGPNIDNSGNATLGEGLIPGKEYLASLDDGTGRKRVVVAVQIPSNFDTANPCIVAGPSSGSRGVYGAIATAGEWGLKRKCAVVLTDAGKGVGLYDPTDDTVNKIDGTRDTRTAAGALSFFAATIADAARTAFNTAFPNRLAIKHAHSQQNPEKDWGLDTLASIRYALYALNQEHGTPVVGGTGKDVRFTAANTTIIAASVSNGGAAVLRAAEQDAEGLIDAVVAGEPSAQPSVPGGATAGYGIRVGGVAVPVYGKPLIDYFTYANLYQACAALAPTAAMTEVSTYNFIVAAGMVPRAGFRCDSLAALGLIPGRLLGDSRDLLSADALRMLREYGFSPENDTMHNAHFGLGNAVIISTMYTNALGRFGVEDNLCNMSMAQVNAATGAIVPVSATTKAQSFALANGTSNGTPATPVVNDAIGGPTSWQFAVSRSNGVADLGVDGAVCQRSLIEGRNVVTGAPLTDTTTPTKVQSDRVRAGMAEVLLSGNLRGKPTLIVAGRSDALLPLNHSERAYVAFNRSVEGAATSQLRYVEVEHAQHFDAFLPLSGFGMRFVPLHPYFIRALDAIWAKLKNGEALPPNQVVRTTVRGGLPTAAPALSINQIPNFVATPAAGDLITISAGNVIEIPN